MFLRIRWFIMGALASVSIVSYLANQLRKARERLTPRSVANSGLRGMANVLDSAAEAVQPKAEESR